MQSSLIKHLGISREQYISEIYMLDDGRVNFPYLEIDIVLGCNLRCIYCTHLSPYRKGYIPTEKIVYWFETWSEKIHPTEIKILGGEPFLHPELATVIFQAREIWKDQKIGLATNGLLIQKAPQNVFDALKEAKVVVHISDHSDADLPYDEIVAGTARLEENNIRYYIWPDNKTWCIQHLWDENNVPIPYKSLSIDAWSVCQSKYHPSLANNQLYKCAILQSMIEGVKEGSLHSSIWEDTRSYKPLSIDDNAATIMNHLLACEVEACSICPDQIYITKSKQLSH